MNTFSAKTVNLNKISIKKQTLISLCAIVTAVALPQFFHVMGAISGMGTALGEIFLPMHLPIIFVGFFAGPFAAALAGAISPIVSFYLTGMPSFALLPFMVIELFSYGLFAGLLKNSKIPVTVKVFMVQFIGRAIRALAILFAVYLLDYSGIKASMILESIPKGMFGIVLQLVLIPLMLYRVKTNE